MPLLKPVFRKDTLEDTGYRDAVISDTTEDFGDDLSGRIVCKIIGRIDRHRKRIVDVMPKKFFHQCLTFIVKLVHDQYLSARRTVNQFQAPDRFTLCKGDRFSLPRSNFAHCRIRIGRKVKARDSLGIDSPFSGFILSRKHPFIFVWGVFNNQFG
jgi:hypothetical protein